MKTNLSYLPSIFAIACAPLPDSKGAIEVTQGGTETTLSPGGTVTWMSDEISVRDNAGKLVEGVSVRIRCEVVNSKNSPALAQGISCASTPATVVSPSAKTTVTVTADSTVKPGVREAFVRLVYESDGYNRLEIAGIELTVTE